MKFIVLLITLTFCAPVFSADKSCLPCFESQEGWYSYHIVNRDKLERSSGLFGKESECQAVRAKDKICGDIEASKPREYCLDCFEYQDGWYSYYIKEGDQLKALSSLYATDAECQAVRLRNPTCRTSGNQ